MLSMDAVTPALLIWRRGQIFTVAMSGGFDRGKRGRAGTQGHPRFMLEGLGPSGIDWTKFDKTREKSGAGDKHSLPQAPHTL